MEQTTSGGAAPNSRVSEQAGGRPQLHERSDSFLPPNLRPSVTQVPVTPGILLRTYSSEGSDKPEGAGASLDCLDYFNSKPRRAMRSDGTDSEAKAPYASAGSVDAKAILHNLSVQRSAGRHESMADIRARVPELELSGNIISATFTVSHLVTYHPGSRWDLKPRPGQSALFDSFSYLSSSPWKHTVVAWTGEIDVARVVSPPQTPPATTVHISPLNQLSKPVPIDGERPLPTPPLHDGLWIAREDMSGLEHQLSHEQHVKTVPVWLADESDDRKDGVRLKDQGRWRRYAEQELYTLFHYKQNEPNDGRKERIHWAHYYRMNQKFADRILELYQPGDIVVVHDYYLLLLPSILKQRVPHMHLAFFLHTPFPSSEFLRCLPRRKEILEGMLGSNLVGFQSYSYSRHFSSCCTRILGYSSDATGVDAYGTRVEVGVFPIGIDAGKVDRRAFAAPVSEKYAALKKMYEGKKIIVGRDRLDSVRGVDKKLEAFERFLDLYPEWHEKVVLIQVTSPTATMEEQQNTESKMASRVNELVMQINGMYGSLSFSPVLHYPQYIDSDEYFALLRAADIGLITSSRDGMNTTSLEYVVCQRDTAGPLILSEFSGTAGFLKDAIHINPWDHTGVAEQIHKALTMSSSKREEMENSLLGHVTAKNVQHWIVGFLHRLVDVLASQKKAIATPLLDRGAMLRQYRVARKRLFMFDYDGTLTPIVREPSAAIPSERVITTLTALAGDERNAVWIISGRDQDFLTQHLSHIPALGFSAEHGSFIRHPGRQEWDNLAESLDMAWQDDVLAVFQKYTDKVPGSFIERKRCALTWHYRQADPEQGLHMARGCQKELEDTVATKWDVDVMPGKANLEVRPTFVNKGEITKRLVASYNGRPSTNELTSAADEPDKLDFVLCTGDDFTDEDMFRALDAISAAGGLNPEYVFTTAVGASTKVTLARWHLLEPEDVVACVGLLAGVGDVDLATLSAVQDRVLEEVGMKN